MRLSSIIKQYEHRYYQHFAGKILPSHRKALSRLKDCRSEHSYQMQLQCDDCEHIRYLPHSCGHRNCPHCQHHESQQWIERQQQKQVNSRYALITFTLPAEFRPQAWSHQRDLYGLMFRCVWETLHQFSQQDKQLKGTPGAIAVLHSNNRRLDYHPHLHVIMPMAAINKQQRLWKEKQGKYLFNHKALATVFRAKMLDGIKKMGYSLPSKHPKKWVVDCKTMDKGKSAIIYLGRYLYRGVIQEKDILRNKNGYITFRYQNGQAKKIETRTVKGEAFLWLLMQHVLPKRFRRSRNYGFLHPNSKLLKLVQCITRIIPPLPKISTRPKMKCPCCGGSMRILQTRLPPSHKTPTQQIAQKPQESLV